MSLLYVSDPDYSVTDLLSKLTHDQDEQVAMNAILALGMIGAGTNNARIAGLLRQLSSFYKSKADPLYVVRIAQGLLHMGKGLVTLSPFHSDNLLMSNTRLAGVLALLFSAFDLKRKTSYVHLMSQSHISKMPTLLFPKSRLNANPAIPP